MNAEILPQPKTQTPHLGTFTKDQRLADDQFHGWKGDCHNDGGIP